MQLQCSILRKNKFVSYEFDLNLPGCLSGHLSLYNSTAPTINIIPMKQKGDKKLKLTILKIKCCYLL